MNVEAVVLKLLLTEENRDSVLESFSELRKDHFSSVFKPIYAQINKFYTEKGKVPNLNELEVFKSRDLNTLNALSSIKLIDVSGIDLDLAVEELINQYAQNELLALLSGFLDKVPMLTRSDLGEELSGLTLALENKLERPEKVFTISDVDIFKSSEDANSTKILSGICDAWDVQEGYYVEELVLYGGKVGSGKSIMCANIVANQYLQGNPSMYFTIEMKAEEVFRRIISILSGVPNSVIKHKTYDDSQIYKICETVSAMYEGGEEFFGANFKAGMCPITYQQDIRKLLPLKQENQIIIIDDRELTTATIDSKVGLYKSRFGDSLKVCVVDYVNQVKLNKDEDMYDWKPQVQVSKELKNCARKHKVCMISPYQMDENGNARFSRGILDAADVAQLIEVQDKETGVVVFRNTKARDTEDKGSYAVTIDWKSLRVDPREVNLDEVLKEKEEEDENPYPPGAGDLM